MLIYLDIRVIAQLHLVHLAAIAVDTPLQTLPSPRSTGPFAAPRPRVRHRRRGSPVVLGIRVPHRAEAVAPMDHEEERQAPNRRNQEPQAARQQQVKTGRAKGVRLAA